MPSGTSLTRSICSAALVLFLSWQSPAVADPSWSRFTGANLSIIDQLSLVRTDDGTLHVVWQTHGVGTSAIRYRTVSASGRASQSTQSIPSGWSALNDPAVVPGPDDSLAVYFGGIRPIPPQFSQGKLAASRSDPTRSIWTLDPAPLSDSTLPYASNQISA